MFFNAAQLPVVAIDSNLEEFLGMLYHDPDD